MAHTTPSPVVYESLEDKPQKPNKKQLGNEFVYKLSIDSKQHKIYLEKANASGFLSFDTTYAQLQKKRDIFMLTLWSTKHKQLLGTLTNQKDRWDEEDIFKIANELSNANIEVKTKKTTTTSQSNAPTQQLKLKSNATKAKNIIIMFWILIGTMGFSILSEIVLLDSLLSLNLSSLTFDEAKQIENGIARQGLINYSIYGISLLGSMFFIRWFKQAHKNLEKTATLDLAYTEHDVRRSFHTPIVNLYRPYHIMKEIWLKTQEAIQTMAPNYQVKTETGFISLWWILFIILEVLLILAQAVLVIGKDLVTGLALHVVFDVCYIVAGMALISLINKIAKEEKRLYKISRRKQPVS